MSKKMNNEAPEKSADQGNGKEAKRDSESTQVDIRQSAFGAVGDEAEIVPAPRTAQARASHEAAFQLPDSDERFDLTDPQRRDVKAYVSPTLDDVKDRIGAARRRGPSRPFEHLAKAESDLHARLCAFRTRWQCAHFRLGQGARSRCSSFSSHPQDWSRQERQGGSPYSDQNAGQVSSLDQVA